MKIETSAVDGAKSAVIYSMVARENTMDRAAQQSFVNQVLKQVPSSYNRDLLSAIQVTTCLSRSQRWHLILTWCCRKLHWMIWNVYSRNTLSTCSSLEHVTLSLSALLPKLKIFERDSLLLALSLQSLHWMIIRIHRHVHFVVLFLYFLFYKVLSLDRF